jgi:hypothetical protein
LYNRKNATPFSAKGDKAMSGLGCLTVKQRKDWINNSKIIIQSENQNLLNSLLMKTSAMSANGYGKVIYNFGYNGNELRIFCQLGSGREVLSHLLDGEDYDLLSMEAKIDTVN